MVWMDYSCDIDGATVLSVDGITLSLTSNDDGVNCTWIGKLVTNGRGSGCAGVGATINDGGGGDYAGVGVTNGGDMY